MTSTATNQEKVPRARPQSIMALEFSATLDSIFGLPSERDLALEQKRMSLQTQSAQLTELQTRLKAMEEKLHQTQNQATTQTSVDTKMTNTSVRGPTPTADNTALRKLVVGQQRPQQTYQVPSSESEEESEEEEAQEEDDSATDEYTSSDEEQEEESEEEEAAQMEPKSRR